MKQIIINKTEEDRKMIVDVKLPARKYARDPVQEFSNSELQEYLKQEGVILSDYELQSQTCKILTSYSTKGQQPNLEGTWVFNKIEKKEESLNKKSSQTYKKSKAKKSGD
jgi:hypothetical protein